MSKSTTKIVLPVSKKEVEVYEYLTERESRKIKDVMLSGIKNKDDIKIENINKSEDVFMSLMVVSMNNEELLDLHSKDYTFLKNKLNELVNFEEKKTI